MFPLDSWEGKGEAEVGKNSETQEVIVRIDPKYYRPTEVEQLLGDPAKATKKLGWKRECDFDVRLVFFSIRFYVWHSTNHAHVDFDQGDDGRRFEIRT